MSNVIRLPVVVIKTANSDGTHDASAAFSDETIKALIDDTNAIFEPDAGIKLVLQEIITIKNTLINRLTDWSIQGCPDAEQTIPNPDPSLAAEGWKLSPCQYAAYDYAAKNYPDKIVVYIRRQSYAKDCQVVDDNGGGFSHKDLNFIALSSWGPTGTLGVMVYPGGPIPGQAPRSYLAHELGHYFGLTHTMPNDWPETQEDATRQLDEYCKINYENSDDVPDNLPDLVWNLDKLADTPGDPGFDLYNKVLFNIESKDATPTKNQCVGAGEFKVYSDFCKREFTVKPARHNLMSYTAQCPYLPGNTTGETQARITPQQRDIILTSLETFRKNLSRLPGPTSKKGMEDYITITCPMWFWNLLSQEPKLPHKETIDEILAKMNSLLHPTPGPGPDPRASMAHVVLNYQLVSQDNSPIAGALINVKIGDELQVFKTDKNGMAKIVVGSVSKDIQITAKHPEYQDRKTKITLLH